MEKLLQNKTLLGVIGGVLLVLFLVVSYVLTSQPQKTFFPAAAKVNAEDHVKWSPAKKVVLVEYSDLQCPACKTLHELIQAEIEKKPESKDITDNVTFVYRHFPLTNIHPNALKAAYAAEAAGNQGKFFEMTDLQFKTQTEWEASKDPTAYFLNLAKQLKLNTEQFQKDMNSEAVKNRVQKDIVSGGEVEVNGTPAFYVNGRKLDVSSMDQFKQELLTTIASENEKK